MDDTRRRDVEMALAGDPLAWEGLVRKYGRLVYAQAYAVVWSAPDAEDVVQEAFLKGYASRRSLRDPGNFVSWMLSIARNKALDAVRRRKPVVREADAPEGAALDDREGAGDAPARPLEVAELREKIFKALDGLPENHRAVVILRYIEGLDYQAIREMTGLSDGALRGILGRALGTLRIELMPYVMS
ncbi:MAG: sigma-70 family RNA polymerase sigma factor [Planctomycetota bacterium]